MANEVAPSTRVLVSAVPKKVDLSADTAPRDIYILGYGGFLSQEEERDAANEVAHGSRTLVRAVLLMYTGTWYSGAVLRSAPQRGYGE